MSGDPGIRGSGLVQVDLRRTLAFEMIPNQRAGNERIIKR